MRFNLRLQHAQASLNQLPRNFTLLLLAGQSAIGHGDVLRTKIHNRANHGSVEQTCRQTGDQCRPKTQIKSLLQIVAVVAIHRRTDEDCNEHRGNRCQHCNVNEFARQTRIRREHRNDRQSEQKKHYV